MILVKLIVLRFCTVIISTLKNNIESFILNWLVTVFQELAGGKSNDFNVYKKIDFD